MRSYVLAAGLLFALASPVRAQQVPAAYGWEPIAGPSTLLARWGWTFLSSSSLSWPDGRQAIVTFWRRPTGADEVPSPTPRTGGTLPPTIARCIEFFSAAMQPTSAPCHKVANMDWLRRE